MTKPTNEGNEHMITFDNFSDPLFPYTDREQARIDERDELACEEARRSKEWKRARRRAREARTRAIRKQLYGGRR